MGNTAPVSYEKLVTELANFFNFLLSRNEAGLAILLGTVPPPSSFDIYEMKHTPSADLGVHIDGGEKIPLAESIVMATSREYDIISRVGGWPRIHRAFRAYRDKYPAGWNLLEEHALFVKQGGLFHDGQGGMMSAIAKKHGDVTTRTIRNRRNAILTIIARFVIYWFPEDEEYHLLG